MTYTRFGSSRIQGVPRSGIRTSTQPLQDDPKNYTQKSPGPEIAYFNQDTRDPKAMHTAEALVLAAFVTSIILPGFVEVGSWKLTASRIVVLLAILPCLFLWARGRAGPIRVYDILLMLFSFWIIFSTWLVHGQSWLAYASISGIETICPYLLARILIRDEGSYKKFLKFSLAAITILLPAAVIEALTSYRPYILFADIFVSTYEMSGRGTPRFGLQRSQVVFEHPILFGVFTAMLFAPTIQLAKSSKNSKKLHKMQVIAVSLCTFLSLSAGAYLSFLIQTMLLSWRQIFRKLNKRWIILASLLIVIYLTIEIISSRSAAAVFADYFTFNSHTAYWRILIFQFGTESVLSNPFLGIGFKDWARPEWMHSASVDNFWLLTAMRHGLPALLLFLTAYIYVIMDMARASLVSSSKKNFRDAHVIALIAFGVALMTVHFWSSAYVYAMFFIGAGIWSTEKTSEVGERDS